MIIPKKFKDILESNQALHTVILDVVTSFQPIFDDNKLFFFEEYTDHGIKHIESVLAAAEFIIADDYVEHLTEKDVAVLILAIILHDIGMHTEFATFVALLNGEYDTLKTCLDSKTWRELWNDYLAEAKRFSSQQKRNIFGDEQQPFKEPDLTNKDNLTGSDKKLIGEFIRRHHARLAHEIALNGLIGRNGQKINFGNEKLPPLYRGIAGIVARSHGMNLRDTFPYLESIGYDSWRNPNGVNVIFLMVVLRIADYIQIDASRVNPFLLKLKTFNSPVSLIENRTHLAIEAINFSQPDSERFDVLCRPTDSNMLVKLQNLFKDIQKELDVSWAILGEVYGFLPEKPKIKFRRITSNLDKTTYLETLPFVPQKISFQVNNELSKLLIAPLYGNRATYGVRELVQNAVDACRERKHLALENETYEPKVTVSIDKIDDKNSLFTITDNGKGMDVEEIIHYFLAVGMSFRKSLAWRKQFVDDKEQTQINRNGKFGIGVLAAFLIGEILTVKTRKRGETTAYSFMATLDSEFIEIIKEQNSDFEIGTTISLNFSNEKREELLKDENKWAGWYVGESPKVEYFLDGKKHEASFKIDRTGFNVFETEKFKNIQWGYIYVKTENEYWRTEKLNTTVACNEIIISKALDSEKSKFKLSNNKDEGFVIEQKPSFLFEDSEGLFPIKLDRNDIDCDELPFEKELYEEVAKSFIAYILSLKINITEKVQNIKLKNVNEETMVLFAKDGYAFNIDYFINKLQKMNFTLIRVVMSHHSIKSSILKHENCVFFLENGQIKLSGSGQLVAPKCGGRVIISQMNYSNLFRYHLTDRIAVGAKNNHKVEHENDEFVIYTIYSFKNPPRVLTEHNLNIMTGCHTEIESIQEVSYKFLQMTIGQYSWNQKSIYLQSGEILHDLLTKYIGDEVIIPYDMTERKQKYKKAFEELAVYMDNLSAKKHNKNSMCD